MSAPRLIAAGRLSPRRPGLETPLAAAERLARFVRSIDGPNSSAIYGELIGWRDREQLPLGDALLAHVASFVAQEPRRVA